MTRSTMSSTRSTPAPSRSASRPGSGRSGPTPDRDRRQDLEADARTGRRPLHTLSAYAREQRLVLAQEVGKSNERALIPSLLDKLRLKGSLVTIDAAGSYRPIAERIVEADYLLTVKANQPKLLAGIKAALAQAAPDTVQRCESVKPPHGRQEHRRCTVAPAGLGGKTPWAGLKSVAAVHGTFVRDGKVTTLTRYYITSRTHSGPTPGGCQGALVD